MMNGRWMGRGRALREHLCCFACLTGGLPLRYQSMMVGAAVAVAAAALAAIVVVVDAGAPLAMGKGIVGVVAAVVRAV